MSHQSALISENIEHYLEQHENKELLRLLTCGSVDDGKSTLIGRLLHDSKMIYEDQLAAIKKDNDRVGNAGDSLDLALLVDGLQAEREQGITIDVAYRYFSTDKRKFIIADTPGHEQYTRNMATGASNCNLAIILIDARYGVQEQTKRHSFIASLLGIQHTIVAINKMDLIQFDQEKFEAIKADYLHFSESLNLPDLQFIPLSALNGDNVVNLSEKTPWYSGAPLLATLENVTLNNDHNFEHLRLPIQYVNRPNLDFRGYCGTITSGVIKKGDEIKVLPSGKRSKVASIVTFDGELEEAYAPMAITLTLKDEIDISRSDIIVHSHEEVIASDRFDAHIVWMSEAPLNIGSTYDIKFLTGRAAGSIGYIHHKIDVNTLQQSQGHNLQLNEIALCEINLEKALLADTYSQLPSTGSFILIDRLTNATVAAGMIEKNRAKKLDTEFSVYKSSQITTEQRSNRFGQKPAAITFKASSDEQLETVLFTLEKKLADLGRTVTALDQRASVEKQREYSELLLSLGFIILTKHNEKIDTEYCIEIGDKEINSHLIEQLITELYSKNLI